MLVQNEVSALERAYHDNEVRIRSLLDDLSAQRDNLIARVDGFKTPDKGGKILMLEAHQDTVPVEGMTIAMPAALRSLVWPMKMSE